MKVLFITLYFCFSIQISIAQNNINKKKDAVIETYGKVYDEVVISGIPRIQYIRKGKYGFKNYEELLEFSFNKKNICTQERIVTIKEYLPDYLRVFKRFEKPGIFEKMSAYNWYSIKDRIFYEIILDNSSNYMNVIFTKAPTAADFK
ncbi:MAG: hypothetical protein JWP69_1583 [Flaviaesturariibacter sp.]|nr:hypothetical protein [Flaviaesturariibacter sp.]